METALLKVTIIGNSHENDIIKRTMDFYSDK